MGERFNATLALKHAFRIIQNTAHNTLKEGLKTEI